jgi:hypothetical protein
MVNPPTTFARVGDQDIKILVAEFSKPQPEFEGKSYVTRRRDWFDKPMQSIRPLLTKDSLPKLSEQEALKIYKEMSVGGPKLYPNTFIENGISKIRSGLSYLLYSSEPLQDRFYNFAGNPESEYRLNGVGRAFASTALFLLDHKENAIWNGAVDGGLEALGLLPKFSNNQNLGTKYIAIVKLMKDLQQRCGFEDLSLTDEFVELICHGKLILPGQKTPVVTPPPELPEPVIVGDEEGEQHLFMQYCLLKIG